MRDLEHACRLLESGGYTCVICSGEEIHTATARGVKPLVNWLDAGFDFSGSCAADKVVGKATAFLYCLLGVRAVYTQVMSEGAAAVLHNAGIEVYWDKLVPGIINRAGTGPCPFEAAVRDITTSADALPVIHRKMEEMGLR